jgi:hypothetical protein
MRTDRQTDTVKLTLTFRDFANAPKNGINDEARPNQAVWQISRHYLGSGYQKLRKPVFETLAPPPAPQHFQTVGISTTPRHSVPRQTTLPFSGHHYHHILSNPFQFTPHSHIFLHKIQSLTKQNCSTICELIIYQNVARNANWLKPSLKAKNLTKRLFQETPIYTDLFGNLFRGTIINPLRH